MNVRKILSARAARPQVEGMLQALVEAAVFIGGADGRFGEEELDVFIDSLREVVTAAVGDDFIDKLASTSKLLDLARAGRRTLTSQGEARFLAALAPRFPGRFARDGLVLAYRVVLADGKVTDKEATAFEALARALGVEVTEIQVLKELAAKTEAASKGGHRGVSVEQLGVLAKAGWQPLPAGPEQGFDAGAVHVQPGGGSVRVELDAGESLLHVHALDTQGHGPHVLCLFGEALPALLAVVDGLKHTLSPQSIGATLPAIRAVCPEVFVEHDGKYARL